MTSRVFIVLATYNGERFLAEQLESLRAQSFSDWRLLVLDDRSDDATLDVLRRFASRDDRIEILEQPASRLRSASASFSRLLAAALERGADWVFCCDQDDVWHASKLATMLEHAHSAGDARPALLHHDLEVVDARLSPLAPSFIGMMDLAPGDEARPQRLISRNEVTGCAMGCNRPVLELALPVPAAAVMHDWWLAMCAAHFGRLVFEPRALVRYRQHGANAIGAKSFWHGLNPLHNWVRGWRAGDEEFLATIRQAEAFLERFRARPELGEAQRRALEEYVRIPQSGRLRRLAALGDFDLWRRHWFLDLMLILRMLLLRRPPGP